MSELPLDQIVVSDALDFVRSLPDRSVDMILSSPPYDNLRSYNGYTWNFEGLAHESYRVLKSGGVLVWIVGDSVVDGSETLLSFKQALYFKEQAGFRMHDTMIRYREGVVFPDKSRYHQQFEYMFVLSKGSPATFNGQRKISRYGGKIKRKSTYRDDGTNLVEKADRLTDDTTLMGNVWRISTGAFLSTRDLIAFSHPAIFPEELVRLHVLTWTNTNDVVLDFFMGSGTTAKIARNLNRHFIGCDISQEYVDLALSRLALTDPYVDRPIAPGVVQRSLFSDSES